jgi:hypothetical protein
VGGGFTGEIFFETPIDRLVFRGIMEVIKSYRRYISDE